MNWFWLVGFGLTWTSAISNFRSDPISQSDQVDHGGVLDFIALIAHRSGADELVLAGGFRADVDVSDFELRRRLGWLAKSKPGSAVEENGPDDGSFHRRTVLRLENIMAKEGQPAPRTFFCPRQKDGFVRSRLPITPDNEPRS